MAKNKKPAKKNVVPQGDPPHKFIIKKARSFPFFDCLINEDWKEVGLASIVITRKRTNGMLILGSYLVDHFCLGLKNTSYEHELTEEEYRELVERNRKTHDIVHMDFIYAQNLIYGAIEYAEDLGFEPNKDFNVTEYILDDVATLEVVDIEFGKNGKLLYIPGPYDNIQLVLKKLDKAVGEGNYNYAVEFNEEEDHLEYLFDEDDEDDEWSDEDEEDFTAYEEIK